MFADLSVDMLVDLSVDMFVDFQLCAFSDVFTTGKSTGGAVDEFCIETIKLLTSSCESAELARIRSMLANTMNFMHVL